MITLAQAARAAGVTTGSLRNWVDRVEIVKRGEKVNKWHAFTLAEVQLIAIIRNLMGIGVRLPVAAQAAKQIMESGLTDTLIGLTIDKELAEIIVLQSGDAIREYESLVVLNVPRILSEVKRKLR